MVLPCSSRNELGVLLVRSLAIVLGFNTLGEIFAYVTVFNPAIEVVTFRLRGQQRGIK